MISQRATDFALSQQKLASLVFHSSMWRAFSISFTVVLLGVAFLVLIQFIPTGGSKPQRVRGDFQSIGSALKAYRKHCSSFPTTGEGLAALVERPSSHPAPEQWERIAEWVPKDPWGKEYRYRLLPERNPPHYELRSAGPDGIDGNEDDFSSLE